MIWLKVLSLMVALYYTVVYIIHIIQAIVPSGYKTRWYRYYMYAALLCWGLLYYLTLKY